jgi:hypothetical protein
MIFGFERIETITLDKILISAYYCTIPEAINLRYERSAVWVSLSTISCLLIPRKSSSTWPTTGLHYQHVVSIATLTALPSEASLLGFVQPIYSVMLMEDISRNHVTYASNLGLSYIYNSSFL